MKIEELFGGRTRFAVLEALDEAKQPMTAYQIAMTKGLDPAATYRCLTEFSKFGIAKSETKRRNQTYYKLSEKIGKAAAEFLRSLRQKPSESIDLAEWISPEMQAERRSEIVRLDTKLSPSAFRKQLTEIIDVKELISNRVSGELSALIESSQIAFNERFEEKDGMFILRD